MGGDDEVARAAAKHRAAEAAKKAKEEAAQRGPSSVERSARETEHRKDMVDRALGGEVGGRLTIIIIAVAVVGGVAGCAFLVTRIGLRSDNAILGACFACAAVILVLALGLPFGVPLVIAAARRRTLRRIGHGFDAAAYIGLLAQNRRKGTLVATLGFARPPDQARRADLADAARGWMPELTSAEWDGDRLRLTSGELEGTWVVPASAKGSGGGVIWSNVRFHERFGHVRDRVVHALDRTAPVAQLDVTIDGGVEPWDATP